MEKEQKNNNVTRLVGRIFELKSELEHRQQREPTANEMERALGNQQETFFDGWTIRRCIDCGQPVAGGPTRCTRCVYLMETACLEATKAELKQVRVECDAERQKVADLKVALGGMVQAAEIAVETNPCACEDDGMCGVCIAAMRLPAARATLAAVEKGG